MAKEKKIKIDDDTLLDYINSCFTEADDYYTQYIQPVTDECWDLYMVKRDYSKKEDWQAKNVSMRAFASVETALSIVKRSLLGAKDFYTVQGQDSGDKENEKPVKAIVDYYLRKAKFYQKFVEALKIAFIKKFGVLKIYWKRWEEEIVGYDFNTVQKPVMAFGQQVGVEPKVERTETTKVIRKSELIVESIDPQNFRLDPHAKLNQKPKYKIEMEEVDFSTLVSLEEQGFYGEKANGESVYKILEEEFKKEPGEAGTGEAPEMTLAQQGGNTKAWVTPTSSKDQEEDEVEKKKSAYRKPVRLIHFWGDLEAEQTLEEGEKITFYENYHVVVANDLHIIRKKKNPNTHGKDPYVIIPCILLPFRAYPVSLIEPIRASLDYLDDMQNACMDALKFDIMKMWGVDVSSIEDPVNDLIRKPGHFIKANLGGQNINQAIQQLGSDTTGIPAAFNMIKWIDGQIQMGVGVVDPLMGMMVSGETTATEYRGTLGQSTVKFMSIAQDIEEYAIAPAIEMVYQLILQNMDIESPLYVEITGESGIPMRQYISPERIAGNFDFYATGITGFMHQLEYVGKMVSTFSTMVQAAPILQLSPQEARTIFKKILKAQGIYDIADDLSDAPNIPQIAQQGLPGGGGGEQVTQPPNPNQGPENLLQMLAGKTQGGM